MSTQDTVLVADAEAPEVLGANIAVGARLLASGAAFLFMAFVFAFFYLRALNTDHAFHIAHGDTPTGFGVVVLACVLGSTAVFEFARRQLRGGTEAAWRAGGFLAVALGLAAVIVQVIAYFNLSFGAADGGLASVFLSFTVVFGLFWLGAVYWMETLWAQSMRQPTSAESEVSAPSRVLRPSADGCVIYLYVMAVIEALAFILLYLVK